MYAMKRIVCFLIVSIAFLSCQKNGDASKDVLIGKWKLTKAETEQVSRGESQIVTSSTYNNSYSQFNEDGTVKVFSEDGKITEYVYSYDKENMTLTIASHTRSIKELTNSSLITYETQQFVDGTPEGGKAYFYSYYSKVK